MTDTAKNACLVAAYVAVCGFVCWWLLRVSEPAETWRPIGLADLLEDEPEELRGNLSVCGCPNCELRAEREAKRERVA